MATVVKEEEEEEGRQEKRPKTALSPPSSHAVIKEIGDSSGDGTVQKEPAHEITKSKFFSNGIGNNKDNREGLTFIIDPDVMNCPICFEELSAPIFQCYNGHLACSPCCSRVENCPFCKCIIGLRCLAVEKIMESIKVSCPYAGSGCEEVTAYSDMHVHKMMCEYSPCHCPAAGCTFEGPMRELCHHFTEEHRGRSISFRYNRLCRVTMPRDEQFRVGHVHDDGVLFLVINKTEVGVGNAVMVACLGPDSMEGEYTSKVKATDQTRGSSVQLKSPVSSMRRWEGTLPQNSFLLIPKDFGGSNQLALEITICKKVDSGCKSTASQKGTTPPSNNPSRSRRTKLPSKRSTTK